MSGSPIKKKKSKKSTEKMQPPRQIPRRKKKLPQNFENKRIFNSLIKTSLMLIVLAALTLIMIHTTDTMTTRSEMFKESKTASVLLWSRAKPIDSCLSEPFVADWYGQSKCFKRSGWD